MKKTERAGPLPLRGLIPALLYALVVIAAFVSVSVRFGGAERDLCQGLAFRAAKDVETGLSDLKTEVSVIALELSRNPDASKAELASLASTLIASRPYITGISIAPSALVRYHFPETAGESLVGHDLLSNPERRNALTLAMELKTPVFSGPFESLEGEPVIFLRYPVYIGQRFWGFASITADFTALVSALDLEASYPGYTFALSETGLLPGTAGVQNSDGNKQSSGDSPSSFIAGSTSAFEQGVRTEALKLEGLAWRLHVMPLKGWASMSLYLYLLGAASLCGAFLLFLVLQKGRTGMVLHPSEVAQEFQFKGVEYQGLAIPALNTDEEPEHKAAPVSASAPMHKSSLAQKLSPAPAPSASPEPLPVGQAETLEPEAETITVQFKGPSVKGQLYMPDVLLSVDPTDPFARLRAETKEKARKARDKANDENKVEEPAKQIELEMEDASQAVNVPEEAETEVPKATEPAGISVDRQPLEVGKPPIFSLEPETDKSNAAILVVDDSEANRDMIGRMLTYRGYKPDFAASGEEALVRCAAREYEIIFMDCFMPGMDGYKASSLIRSAHPAVATKIVGMSAKVGDQELARCTQAGMNDLLTKPFTLRQLVSLIE